MALQIPGYTVMPNSPSPLDGVMEAFDQGRQQRRDEQALDAAAKAFGAGGQIMPAPPSAIERLSGLFSPGQPQTALAAANAAAAPVDIVTQSHNAAAAATDPVLTDYFARARTAESGGNDLAANPNSSALGRYQFLASTWDGLMNQYPELGLTPNGRTDPEQQERAMARFTQDNAQALSGSGIPVNPGNLYAAHFLGAGGASNVLRQDPSSPLNAYLDPGVLEANPHLNGMTVGDFSAWANSKGGNSSGGYAPPARDEGRVAGARQFTPDPETLRALLSSDATRELAVSLITAQQNANASQGRYVVEQGPNGAVFQRDTLTGETRAILTPDQANGSKGDESFFGNPVPYQDAEGNIRFGQIGNKGTFKPIDLGGAGGQFVSPTKTVNTETEQIVMDQFGNVLSRMPIQNAQAAQDTARGKGIGEAQAAGIVGAPQANANAETLLSQIDGVLNDASLPQAIGLGGLLPAIPNTDQAGVVTKIEQLQGQAFLQAFETLKGAGQITEVEGAKATAAIARLSRVQNLKDFKAALDELRSLVVAAQQRAQAKGGIGDATPTSTGAAPVQIRTAEDYLALPPGTQYVDPDGNVRTKP